MNNIPPVPSILQNKFIEMEIKTVSHLLSTKDEHFQKRMGVGEKSFNAFVEFKTAVKQAIAEFEEDVELSGLKLNFSGSSLSGVSRGEQQIQIPKDFDSELSEDPLYLVLAFEQALGEFIEILDNRKKRKYSLRSVVESYYGLNRQHPVSMSKIAISTKVTSARIQQLIAEALAGFRLLLNGAGSSIPSMVLHDDLKKFILDVKSNLQSERIFDLETFYVIMGFASESASSFTESIVSFLLDVFQVKTGSPSKFNRTEGKFFFIGVDTNTMQNEFAFTCKRLITVLNEPGAELSETDCIGSVHRKKPNINPELIRKALFLLPEIECSEESGLYRIRFAKLSKGASRAYRVLSEKGEPMHIDEILKEVNHRLSLAGTIKSYTRESLQLPANKNLFRARGKTGVWGLVEWPDWDDVATATIDEVIKMVFKQKNRPLRLEELYTFVENLRTDIRRDAVNARCSDLCVKLDNDTFVLNEWKGIPHFRSNLSQPKRKVLNSEISRSPKTKEICSMIVEFLERQPDSMALSADLTSYVLTRYKSSKPLLYKLFREEKYLLKEKSESGKLLIRLKNGYNPSSF